MSTFDDITHDEYADKAKNTSEIDDNTTPGTDDKGRVLVQCLSDRELLKESVVLLRAFGDALEALANHPMAGALGLKR